MLINCMDYKRFRQQNRQDPTLSGDQQREVTMEQKVVQCK